jgi:hypothetical protein
VIRGIGLGNGIRLIGRDHERTAEPKIASKCTRQGAESTKLSDDDAQALQRTRTRAKPLAFAHGCDAWAATGLTTEAFDGLECFIATGPIGEQSAVSLEFLNRLRSSGAQDTVDPATIEADASELGLEIGNIVTAEIRRREKKESITEAP